MQEKSGSVWWVLLWSLLVLPVSYAGEAGSQLYVQSALSDAGLEMLKGQLEPGGAPWHLEPLSSPRLLEALQLSNLEEQKRSCEGSARSLQDHLEEAKRRLIREELREATRLLEGWHEVFLCEVDPVSAQTLAQGVELVAWLRLRKGEPEAGLYREVLRINPQQPEPTDEGREAVAAYRAAREFLTKPVLLNVQLPADVLSDWTVWLDGAAVRVSEPLKLAPGQHYLQLIGQDGRVKYARVLAFAGTEDGKAVVWPSRDQLPLARQKVYQELQGGLSSGVMTGEQRRALEQVRRHLGAERLVLLTSVSCGQLVGVQLEAGKWVKVQQQVPCEQAHEKAQKPGKLVSAVLGGLALGLGGWTGYQYATLNDTMVSSEAERERLLMRYVWSAGGAGVTGLGALVSAGLVWQGRW